ncbi:site-specific integrase [Sulfobacillus sp. hq2]|uniref:site-specific integrase n=1 Tax=Sulfobacillus sp. hq2 TaxID=2039167 RepID=UPI00210069E3|nr:site-specific integrase [Sulfobacillus sp. hq2]
MLWKFIALTGVRRGEALALRWEDIDWERRVVTIQRTFSGSGRKRRTLNTPKTQRGVRTITIPEILVNELEAQRKQQQLERQVAGDDWGKPDLCLPPQGVRRWTPVRSRSRLRSYWQRLVYRTRGDCMTCAMRWRRTGWRAG